MTVPLNELSSVYREFISEEDNTPEAVSQRVSQIVKAIRYRARKEGDPLNKSYNDYIGSVNATSVERQAVKEKLGLTGGVSHKEEVEHVEEKALSKQQQKFMGMVHAVKKGEMEAPSPEVAKAAASMTGKEAKDFASTKHKGLPAKVKVKESFSDWRQDLSEVVDGTDSEKQIKEKKVKNKVAINPVMSEAVQELGGEVLEIIEVNDEMPMSPQEIMLQKRKAQLNLMIARKRQQTVSKQKQMNNESTEDRLRDMRQERGGVDGNKRYDRKSPFVTNTKKHGVPGAKTPAQVEMEKKYGKGASAMDVVKAQIRAKYGKGSIMDPKKKN